MTTLDAIATVLQCRCWMDDTLFEIEVAVHQTKQPATYHAVAFIAAHEGESRQPVVNDRGLPLVAVGISPEKAALFLSSALRRKRRRGDVRSPGAAGARASSGVAAAGSE